MSTTATIEPRTKIVGANHTDVQISANPWNQPRIVTGGSTGGLFVRDTVQSDGWGLINAVAAGQVLASAGVNTVPVWTATPTLTSITVTTINTPGGASDIGSSSTPFRSGYFSTSVAIGTNPANTGALRIANSEGVRVRNAANTGDIQLMSVDSADNIGIGYGGTVHPASVGIQVGPSYAGLGVSGSTSTPFTWTVTSSGHFWPQNDNAYDIGSVTAAKRVRGVYAMSIALGSSPSSSGEVRLPYGGYIKSRNATNDADRYLLGLDTTGGTNRVMVGDSGANTVIPGSGDDAGSLGASNARWSTGYVRTIYADASVNTNTVQSLPGNNLTLAGLGATSGLLFYGGSANRWGMNQVGTWYPVADNATQLGGSTNRVSLGYFGTRVLIGTNPAVGGSLALQNAGLIMVRNGANTADLHMLSLNASNQVIITDTAVPLIVYGGTLVMGSAALSLSPAFKSSGANMLCTTGDGAKYTPFTAGELRAQISSTESGIVIADSAIVVGSNTATGGSIRLAQSGSIKFKSGAGELYLVSFGFENAGTQQVIYFGSSGCFAVAPGSGSGLGTTATPWPWLSVGGANPAQSGAIRLANNSWVFSRNAANTADVAVIGYANDGNLYLGAAAVPVLPYADNSLDFGSSAFRWRHQQLAGYCEHSEMTAPAAPAADRVRLYAEDNGSGKTRLMALFATGAAVQVAIQP